MDKPARPSFRHQSCSLDELNEQQDPSSTAAPQCSASVPKSCVVRNAGVARRTMGGSQFTPIRCCGDGQQRQDVDAMGVDGGGAIVMSNGSNSAMDGGMEAWSQWVTVAAMRGDTTTSRVKREGGVMRGNVQPADVLRGSVAMRGDATTSQSKHEGGMMRCKVTTSWCIERQWQRQGDATTSLGKQEGGASRCDVTTSQHIARQWRNER
jgi:hypothetical protein